MKKTLLFLTAILFSVAGSYASHIMGAAITYNCLGGNNYEVTLKIYSDCAGVAVGTQPQNVNFQSAACSQNFSRPLPLISSSQIVQTCPSVLTTCNGGTFNGSEEHIFRDTVTLSSCFDWVMSWDLCCRNNSTMNLTNPGANSIYIETTLNSVAAPCNNSPEYISIPVSQLCVGELAILNVGAIDSDGDSLIFQFANPLTASGVNIPYNPGYSLNSPMTSSSGINLNAQTGELCFTPSISEVAALAILVSEYRNGVLIGSQIRDLQIFITASCTNLSPSTSITASCGNYSGMTVTQQGSTVNIVDDNSIIMCPNDTICFDVVFSDPDTNNISIISNIASAIPGATLTILNDSTPNPTATFCWIPSLADVGLNVFSLVAQDDACPINGVQNFIYDIEVIDANCFSSVPCNDTASFTYVDNGNGNYSFTNTSVGSFYLSNWSFGDGVSTQTTSPNHTFVANGSYVVVLAIVDSSNGNFCIDYANVGVNVTGVIAPPACNAAFSIYPDTVLNTITVVNSSSGTNLTYFWDFGDSTTSTLQYPNHTYATAGPFYLCLKVNDGNGCIETYCDSINSAGLVLKQAGFDINVIAPPIFTNVNDNPELNSEVTVYPNPASNMLSIAYDQLTVNEINIIDIAGKKLKTIRTNLKSINVSNLSPGIYFLEMVTKEKTIIQKFVKQ